MNSLKCRFFCIGLLLLIVPELTNAKSRYISPATTNTALNKSLPIGSAASLRKLESLVTPLLDQWIAGKRTGSNSTYTPSDKDFMTLARSWDRLSPAFLAKYQKAMALPVGMTVFTTPGRHFDILYTISGTDAVDTRDTYQFGPDAAGWRVRTETANGVPDYVDEVGYAMDSSWSMLIDRFGFIPPSGYAESSGYTSNRYKVVLSNMDPWFYGNTVFVGPDSAMGRGFLSYIMLRSNWNDANYWSARYRANPELPVRVTSVSTFYNAIQYAMCWSVDGSTYLDDYTLGWIAGTATLMEDLGFDSVNDYLQYTAEYFYRPDRSLFATDLGGTHNYASVLLALYLYNHARAYPTIDFIRNMLYNNYNVRTPFQNNLELSAYSVGTSWPQLLGSFHARSYFTGGRARPGFFIPDADSLPQWQPDTTEAYQGGFALTKNIDSCAFKTFHLRHTALPGNALKVLFLGRHDTVTTNTDKNWAVNILLKHADRPQFDTIVSIPLRLTTVDTFTIRNWNQYSDLLLLASNAATSGQGYAKVVFDTMQITGAGEIRRDHIPAASGGGFSLRAPLVRNGGSSVLISFDLLSPGNTDLSVYSMTGKQVTVLASGVDQKTGSHQVLWKPGRTAGGRYMVVMRYGGSTQTRGLVIPSGAEEKH